MELVNFLRGLGYPIVAAGKGKNNAFRIDATPDAYVEEATRRNMNPRMLVEFVDGSKTMVEMVALANATGLIPDIPGMHGPSAPVDSLHKVFCPREEGGLLSRKGVVDFTVARGVAPGVFAVAELRHPRLRERMNDLQLGEGPYYTFYRPYHLTSLEVPLSAAAAVLYGQSHMRPLACPSAEVGARAKRDLAPGETLDAIGEYCYRGFALSRADAIASERAAARARARRRRDAQDRRGRLPYLRELRTGRAPADRAGAARAGRLGPHGRCRLTLARPDHRMKPQLSPATRLHDDRPPRATGTRGARRRRRCAPR